MIHDNLLFSNRTAMQNNNTFHWTSYTSIPKRLTREKGAFNHLPSQKFAKRVARGHTVLVMISQHGWACRYAFLATHESPHASADRSQLHSIMRH